MEHGLPKIEQSEDILDVNIETYKSIADIQETSWPFYPMTIMFSNQYTL